MARILESGLAVGNTIHIARVLAENLPQDYFVVEMPESLGDASLIKFHMAVLRPTALFVIDLFGDRLGAQVSAAQLGLGDWKVALQERSEALIRYLRQPEVAAFIFDDPRAVLVLCASPIIVIPKPLGEESELCHTGLMPRTLTLDETIRYILDPLPRFAYGKLKPSEMSRLGTLLRGRDYHRRISAQLDSAAHLLSEGEYADCRQLLQDIGFLPFPDLVERSKSLGQALQEVESLVQTAQEHANSGRFDEASHLYKQALRISPGSSQLNVRHSQLEDAHHYLTRANEELASRDYRCAFQYYHKLAFGEYSSQPGVKKHALDFWSRATSLVLAESLQAINVHNYQAAAMTLAPFLQEKPVAAFQESVDRSLYSLAQCSGQKIRAQELVQEARDAARTGRWAAALQCFQLAVNVESQSTDAIAAYAQAALNALPLETREERSSLYGLLEDLRHSTSERIDEINSLHEQTTIEAARAIAETGIAEVLGQVRAYLLTDDIDKPLELNVPYELAVEVWRNKPKDETGRVTLSAAVGLADLPEDLELVVTIYSDAAEVTPHWQQMLQINRGQERAKIRFFLTPRKAGRSELLIEFYHGNRWLQKLTTQLEVVA